MCYFSLGRDISVYTGTSGILKYPDVNNNPQDIYLYNSHYIPAPLYYWKVLQDKVHSQAQLVDTLTVLLHYKYQIFLLLHFQRSNTAAAFIGVNDPHKTSVPLELCTNRWVKYFYSTEKLILHIWWGVALIFVNGLQRQYQVHFQKVMSISVSCSFTI